MFSTLETLSDDVLVVICQYTGNISTIFQTFFNLNQRLNDILLKKLPFALRHLFSQISSIKLDSDRQQYFRTVISNYVKEQHRESGYHVRSLFDTFQAMREKHSPTDMIDIDNRLQKEWLNLQTTAPKIQSIKSLQALLSTRAARLQCDTHEPNQFNFARTLNRFLLRYLNDTNPANDLLIQPITHLLQSMILSNADILLDRDYTEIEESSTVWYFLFYSIYKLQYWYYTPPNITVNMECYQAVLQLLIFAIQCHKQNSARNEKWPRESLFAVLKMIGKTETSPQNNLVIQTVQREVLNIIVEENILMPALPWQEEDDRAFQSIFAKLIEQNRLDVLLLIYHQLPIVRLYFEESKNLSKTLNILTGSSPGRQLLKLFFDEKPVETWLISKEFFFLLLSKKERQFIERILKLKPELVHTMDEYGNNPLMYVCLKVRGCRQRIVQYLIQIGCDVQQRNHEGENFFDAIQTKNNQKLRKQLDVPSTIF
ncbi:unnamed protein product [Adineta ricciae]|uniref:Uncharacterized protein n=1 Tax=Adineta ricciae TaxID=249248 RepID=A0A815D3D3_ADIRI|nr:unnamed protein product [Adineta ricciae]